MLFSYVWLGDWIDHGLTPEKLAEGLTSLGLECGIVNDNRGKFDKVVIGHVESVIKHPDADKLSLCEVSAGGEKLSIVCGAPNIAAGQKVPVALPGAKLPDGLRVEKRKVRGVTSEGMICSEAELGISDNHDGIMVLGDGCVSGEPLSKYVEVEDVILEVDLTPNRGDCLSLLGIAREVSALTGEKVKYEKYTPPQTGIGGFSVKMEYPDGCPRYTASEISGVKVTASPLNIRRRLNAVGIRPISNIVDATNYVMIETGHPLHAFDRRDIAGNAIVVRPARKNEKLKTLDGRPHDLVEGDVVIADAEKGVALAGIMGGENSEVKDDTADVILEAAYFDPRFVRRTSKRLGISSESSYRFERGVNPEGLRFASLRAAHMMAGLSGGKVGGFIDEYPRKVEFPYLTLRTQKVNDMLGIELDEGAIGAYLARLGIEYSKETGNFKCPPHRHDLSVEADLVEEIARLHGYGNIPSTVARLAQHETEGPDSYRQRSRLNRLFAAAGLSETISYSFINPAWRDWMQIGGDAIKLKNRVNADWSEMRTSLLPGLMNAASFNLRQGEERIGIFETGVVFSAGNSESAQGAEEFMCAGLMTCGMEEIFGTRIPRDFSRFRGIVSKVVRELTGREPEMTRPDIPKPFLYPQRQVDITAGSRRIGFLGQVHPLVAEKFQVGCEIVCFEFSVEILLQSLVGAVRVEPLPRFPGIKRDLALIVDAGEEVAGLVKTIMETDSRRIRSCRMFDLYRGKQIPDGKKSLAFRLVFLDEGKTMTDETGDAIMKSILENVKVGHGAEIRGA